MAVGPGELTRQIQSEVTDLQFAAGDNFSLVVAVDFGTTYSGYAFSFKNNQKEVFINASWGTEVGTTSYKTPTCVVTDSKDKFIAFGYEGLKKYVDNLDSGVTYHLYDRFKMGLYKEKVIGEKTTITSRDGRVTKVEIILSLALKYLFNHIRTALQASNISKINNKQIRWVLTVPAIWSESAKQMMRRSAYKAGIIDSLGSKRLIIALEPEAASFWCRQLTLDQFSCSSDSSELKLEMPIGTTYMVVDCGGGTIDVTVHELSSQTKVKEVHRATGGAWGGIQVDKGFVDIMEKAFGINFIKQYTKDYPQDWLSIIVHFETIKRSYDPDSNETMNIPLTMNFGMVVFEQKSKKPDLVVQEAKVDGVECKQGHLVIQRRVIEKMFLPTISKVQAHISDLLGKPEVCSIKYIFLVGGFSDCKLLQRTLTCAFSSKIKVMVPQDAGMVIMKGAVLYGHTPDVIASRISRRTYGETLYFPFVDGEHESGRKVVIDGDERCSLFTPWVKKNETIQTGESRSFTCVPRDSTTTSCTIGIKSSDRDADDIMYGDEPGVECVGSLTIQAPDTHINNWDRTIKTEVIFGGTEMHVRSQDMTREQGDFAEINIDFLSG